jgi:uncharacterized membrane protein
MVNKLKIFNSISELTFKIVSQPLTWVISVFPRFYIGRAIALIMLFFYTIPILLVLILIGFIILPYRLNNIKKATEKQNENKRRSKAINRTKGS